MTSTHKVPKKITAILALVFLLPSLYIFGIWLKVFRQDISPSQKISSFTDYFPSLMNDYKGILVISIVFCVLAMILAAKSFKQPLLFLRILMWLTVIVAALIFFLTVFQLL